MKRSAKRKLKSEMKKALAALLAAGAAALYYFLSPYLAPEAPAGELEVHFIDVGQGDAILLRCDGEAALVDAGTPDCRESLLEYLQNQRLEEPKYVFASHPHADHIGSMAAVIDAFGCQTFIMPDMVSYTRAFENMLDSVERCGAETQLGKAGDTFELGQAQLELLWPAQGYEADDANNISLVIRVTYGPYSFLLTGDAESSVEKEFVSNLPATTVLKAGHHGSKTSSSQALLEAARPKYCVISVGAGNSYGHPSPETLEKLEQLGCQIYRTDLQGDIVFRIEEGQLYVDTAR